MIANAVQRGGSIYLYDETGQDLPVSISTRGGRLVGFTPSTVSIQNGTLIYTYDKWGNAVGTPISTSSQGSVQSGGSQGNSNYINDNTINNYGSGDGVIGDIIERASNYVYRKKWINKNIFGKVLTLILLPFVICISIIGIMFIALRWLFIAALTLGGLYFVYIIFLA